MRGALVLSLSLLIAQCFFLPQQASAQDDVYVAPPTKPERPPDYSTVHIGPGIGQEYGGLGVQLSFLAAPRVRAFGGVGFALAGLGYNVGGQFRILPKSKWCPYVSAMYGYTAAIYVRNGDQFNKLYYGPSFGTGVELHKRRSSTFWRFGFTVPIRPQEFYDDWDALLANPNIQVQEGQSEPPPVTICVGIHWAI